MNRQFIQLFISHVKEIVREPGVLFWGIGFPILMSWGLGIAFTERGDIMRKTAIVREADGKLAPEALALFDSLGVVPASKPNFYEHTHENGKLGKIHYLFEVTNWDSANIYLKRGMVNMVISWSDSGAVYHFDPVNPEAQLTYMQVQQFLSKQQDISQQNNNSIQTLSLAGTRYIDFLIPGLISMGIMMSVMWGISYGMIERRKLKLLRRMIATPMNKAYFLASIILARVLINAAEAGVLFIFAYFYFDITLQGSWLAFLSLFIAGNLAFSGIAILASSRTSNTEIGNGVINAVVTPMMILSGIFFSYRNFPDWSVMFIQYLPLTMLTDGVRSVFNEGAGMLFVMPAVAILSFIGIASFTIGLKIFKWY